MAKSKKGSLYLFESPFLVEDTEQHRFAYLSETSRLNEYERLDEVEIKKLLVRFAIDAELIAIVGEEAEFNPTSDMGSLQYLQSTINYRSMIDLTQLTRILHALQNGEQFYMNQVLDVHARLGTMYSPTLLNTIVNRTIKAISTIPYKFHPTPGNDKPLTWEEIHQEYPFLWLLIYLQMILRNEVKRLK